MTLFNSYYPPAEYDFRHDDRLTSFYRNYEVIADCVCDDTLQAYVSRGEDPELCVPSLVILLHQMHQEILSLREEVDQLKWGTK
jgi:hypothetical protein